MSAALAVFYVLSAVTVAGALGVVLDRNVVRSALMLLVALLGVAGLFLLAFAEFLALTQVLIYGGAVTIVVLFAVMLTRARDLRARLDNPQRPLAALIAVASFVLLTAAFVASDAPATAGASSVATSEAGPGASGFETIGNALFTHWAIPFEVASLVLLVALVGAVILARRDESPSDGGHRDLEEAQ